jgi:HAD superfamily hydrolase (TIGR01509 family)
MTEPGTSARERSVRAVLLDIDGTLVDSNDAHALSWAETLSAFGHPVSFDEARRKVGEGGDKMLAQLAGLDECAPHAREILEARKLAFGKLLPDIRPFDGSRELVLALRARGLRIVVATSAAAEEAGPLLRIAQVDDLLDARTSADDAPRSKPDPDIVSAAIRRSGVPPHACAMIGDTPYDVLAAHRAGARVVALRCGGWSDAELAEADAIYDGPRDLCAHLSSSLFGA